MQIKFQDALRKACLMILPKINNEGRNNLPPTSKLNTESLKIQKSLKNDRYLKIKFECKYKMLEVRLKRKPQGIWKIPYC